LFLEAGALAEMKWNRTTSSMRRIPMKLADMASWTSEIIVQVGRRDGGEKLK